MHYNYLTQDFAVSPQIFIQDVPTIREAGFRTVICNRPDGEEIDQPDSETIGHSVREAGLFFIMLPVKAGSIPSSDTVQKMQEALRTLPGPFLAYCRTGNRAAQVYNMATQNV